MTGFHLTDHVLDQEAAACSSGAACGSLTPLLQLHVTLENK